MGAMTGVPGIIAIDGPAGSGKSTLGVNLAEHLGYLYFDTGVMYRAVTLAALERCIPIEDEKAITALAEAIDIDVRQPSKADGRAYDVWVEGADVTWEIRRPKVEAHVSVVSAYPGVRRALGAQQRRIGLRGKVVMVGRDIGTVVLPEADLKIYLDASVEERARRRFEERHQRGEFSTRMGEEQTEEAVLQSMRRRDQIDSTRQTAPLRPAQDAVILNSDGLDAGQVLERVKRLIS
jgi:cytidylate kinase